MEKNVDMTALANYVRVRPPDKDKLAELVIRAKGARRSMRQFAIECGINPSTMSRIVNKKTAGASSDEVIISIADHADEDSGITVEMLMDAHGKVTRQMTGRVRNESYSLMETAMKDILMKELLVREYTLSTSKTEVLHNALNYRYRTDWALLTDANSEKGNLELWEFEFWPTILDGERDIRHTAMKLRQKFLMVLGLYYTGDMSPKKMSFVLTDRKVYEYLISTLDGISFKALFSFILVDLDRAIVDEEHVFPLQGFTKIESVFFQIPDSGDNEAEENEEDDEDTDNEWEDKLFDI